MTLLHEREKALNLARNLKKENENLKHQLDEIKQYLIRIAGGCEYPRTMGQIALNKLLER